MDGLIDYLLFYVPLKYGDDETSLLKPTSGLA
jgi:hypothetical protein